MCVGGGHCTVDIGLRAYCVWWGGIAVPTLKNPFDVRSGVAAPLTRGGGRAITSMAARGAAG